MSRPPDQDQRPVHSPGELPGTAPGELQSHRRRFGRGTQLGLEGVGRIGGRVAGPLRRRGRRDGDPERSHSERASRFQPPGPDRPARTAGAGPAAEGHSEDPPAQNLQVRVQGPDLRVVEHQVGRRPPPDQEEGPAERVSCVLRPPGRRDLQGQRSCRPARRPERSEQGNVVHVGSAIQGPSVKAKTPGPCKKRPVSAGPGLDPAITADAVRYAGRRAGPARHNSNPRVGSPGKHPRRPPCRPRPGAIPPPVAVGFTGVSGVTSQGVVESEQNRDCQKNCNRS